MIMNIDKQLLKKISANPILLICNQPDQVKFIFGKKRLFLH